MNLDEKAKEYALKAMKDQLEQVENAYKQGYADALKTVIREPFVDGKNTYVDLGLASGTLWTTYFAADNTGNTINCGYYQASMMNIPTQEQFEEMFKRCQTWSNSDAIHYVGPSSEIVRIWNRTTTIVWVKSDIVDDCALAYVFRYNSEPELKRVFVGQKHHVLLVKTK